MMKYVIDMFSKIKRHKTEDAMSKTLRYKFELTKILNNCTPTQVRYYIITVSVLFTYMYINWHSIFVIQNIWSNMA